MTGAGLLLAVALAVPVIMLIACLSRPIRAQMPRLLAWAPVPALASALLASGRATIVLPDALLGATLALDAPGAILLGVAALLWIAAGAYAATYMRDTSDGGFSIWWLLALTGNIGVFMAADIASFYLFFAMGSLAAYGLIVHDNTARANHAGAVYVGFALLGEACVLMGLVLLASVTPNDSLLIRDAVAALPASPWRDATLALLITGFALKIGLVPLHVWMPLAYAAAPLPAAAVLSGAAVKAGVIGLIKFLPFEAAHPGWGEALAAAGLFSAFYGVAIGVTQSNPKTVLAYSSVSQMGLIAAVIGMGLSTGNGTTASVVAFVAAHHVLVKGALFLAIGVAAASDARHMWRLRIPATVIALGLAGLPLTGGALAKAAAKAPLGDGVAGGLAALAAAGTALLMFHFLKCLADVTAKDEDETPPSGLTAPWLAMAVASVTVPWMLVPSPSSEALPDVLSLAGLWEGIWPVLLGGALAIGLWGRALPQIPAGDVGTAALARGLRAIDIGSAAFERADLVLRQWPVAGALLLGLTVALGAALTMGHQTLPSFSELTQFGKRTIYYAERSHFPQGIATFELTLREHRNLFRPGKGVDVVPVD